MDFLNLDLEHEYKKDVIFLIEENELLDIQIKKEMSKREAAKIIVTQKILEKNEDGCELLPF